jgi:galactonate dehydratase
MATSRRSFITKAAVAAAITPFASLTSFGQGYEQAIDKTPKRSAPADLKITDVKCGYIRGSVMVKIYTNQDIWGCGEGVDAIPGTYHLVKNFGNRLKGKNPLNVHRLFEDIRRSGFFQGAQSGNVCCSSFCNRNSVMGYCRQGIELTLFTNYSVESFVIK